MAARNICRFESDTIGGFNSMLQKQKDEPGECRITTVLFDNDYEILHDRIEIKAVSPVTEREYFVRGSTALLDAVGKTINKIGGAQKNTAEEYRAGKVLFVITTDGMENSSREFGYDRIKAMIEHQKSKYNWEFIFLGANIDAVETADRFGIAENRTVNFHNDREGIELNYRVVSETAAAVRGAPAGGKLSDTWGRKSTADYKKRGKR
jgi:uncharacterized protein YegL